MLRLLFFLKKNDLVYINTVLPFGAALIANLKSCRIIYHVHEVTINPRILKWLLLSIVKKVIYAIINAKKILASTGIELCAKIGAVKIIPAILINTKRRIIKSAIKMFVIL